MAAKKRCQARVRAGHKNAEGGKSCLKKASKGSSYCKQHLELREMQSASSELIVLYQFFEKYFSEIIVMIKTDRKELTIGEIYDYIQYCVTEYEQRWASIDSIKNWYHKVKIQEGFPVIPTGGSARQPYLALLTGENPMPKECPVCGKPATSKTGYWTPMGLKQHKEYCGGKGSWPPEVKQEYKPYNPENPRHQEVLSRHEAGHDSVFIANEMDYALNTVRNIISYVTKEETKSFTPGDFAHQMPDDSVDEGEEKDFEPAWSSRIEHYLEQIEGENPFNFESDGYIGLDENPEELKKQLIYEFDRMETGNYRRGILYAGLLAKFEDLYFSRTSGSDESGLLASHNEDLKIYIGPDGPDGGIDAILVDDAGARIIVVQAKASRSHATPYGEIAQLFSDSTKRIKEGSLRGCASVDEAWRTRMTSCNELCVSSDYSIEPVFISNKIEEATLESINPDHYPDLKIEVHENFIEKDDFIELAGEFRISPHRSMPRISLTFSQNPIQELSTIDDIPTTVYLGLVRLTDLVKHFSKKQVKPHLFASNVRYWLRDAAFKKILKNTLSKKPEEFLLLNNGISAVARGNVQIQTGGGYSFQDFLVINGAQTISTAESLINPRSGDGLEVPDTCLVPIRITLVDSANPDSVRKVVTKISVANNRQRPINPSDLFTNHKIHRSLKYRLKRFSIFYATKSQEFKGTVGHLTKRSRQKYWFDKCPIKVVKDMKNNLLDTKEPRPKTNKPNQLDMLKFTPYLLALAGRPIASRLGRQSHYGDAISHQRLWCHYENSIENGGSDDNEIGVQEFNHKLFCFCAGAFLQNGVMGAKLILNTDLKERLTAVYGYNDTETNKQARNLIYNARWFFLHVFKKKFETEIEDLITDSTAGNIGSHIDSFFDEPEKFNFINALPEKLIDSIELVNTKVSNHEAGYESVGMERQGRFFQHKTCLKEFENIVGV